MKLFIASDIHGSAKYCSWALEAYKRENADRLILLGDILYHGPRNPLPENYSPAEVAKMLGHYAQNITCVRGNCDSEVDQLVLDFPVLSDYAEVFCDGLRIALSHGHKPVPPLGEDDIYITGHTHLPIKEYCGYHHLNPGSVSLPKDNSPHGYILYEDGCFYFKELDGKIYDRLIISRA